MSRWDRGSGYEELGQGAHVSNSIAKLPLCSKDQPSISFFSSFIAAPPSTPSNTISSRSRNKIHGSFPCPTHEAHSRWCPPQPLRRPTPRPLPHRSPHYSLCHLLRIVFQNLSSSFVHCSSRISYVKLIIVVISVQIVLSDRP